MLIVIGDIPPSNNKYLGNSRSFRVYGRDKEDWHWKVKAAISESGDRPSVPLEKAVVTITYYFKDRRPRDPDNFSGKFILDALVREGVIADDSFWNIELVLRASVDRDNPRTLVCVESV